MSDSNRIRESDQQLMREFARQYPKTFRGLLIAWFTADGYPKMRAAAVDSDRLCDDFAEFERTNADRYNQAVADGHPVEKIMLDADALIAWCGKEGRPLDATARSMFAILTVLERDSRGGRA